MQLPVQVTFHGLSHSDAIEASAREHAAKLDTFHERIMSCRIAIEAPHRHRHEGRQYRVRIDLGVPGEEIVVGREIGAESDDVYAALDAAFDRAQRRLRDFVQRQRGDVKPHEHARHGTVSKLFTYEGYGFIRTEEGDELYFHRNSVLNHGFERMKRGSRVRYTEAMGDDGMHASTVVLRHERRVAREQTR